jgi:hypothetical protein
LSTAWANLENLIVVAGHAIYVAPDFKNVADDKSWVLQEIQQGEPPFYMEHMRRGVELAASDPKALLVFSGGQTRGDVTTGPRSEAQSYWILSNHHHWWGEGLVAGRATTEEFARDSFENLLFSILRFHECTGRYPKSITVVSWAFKEERFGLHRDAICWPGEDFAFVGPNNPVDLEGALTGERQAIAAFAADPLGTGDDLVGKRARLNPWRRTTPYRIDGRSTEELLLSPRFPWVVASRSRKPAP